MGATASHRGRDNEVYSWAGPDSPICIKVYKVGERRRAQRECHALNLIALEVLDEQGLCQRLDLGQGQHVRAVRVGGVGRLDEQLGPWVRVRPAAGIG
ncbi:MAG: hypothetical protein ACRDRU_11855 [Pseudonocardiaceae bacterium]